MDVDQIENGTEIYGEEGEKYLEPLLQDIPQCKATDNKVLALSTDIGTTAEESGSESDDHGYELLEGIRFSDSLVEFKDIKSFENFTILVDGLVLDSEVPSNLWIKYCKLCCSQSAFLHDHLLGGLNCKLAAGIISETVNIADAIRASNLTTSRDDFKTWEQTLRAFDKLGMNVGFLCARLDRLSSLVFELEKVLEPKKLERGQAEEVMKALEAKLLQVKTVRKNLDEEIEGPEADNKKREFQEEVNAPW